MPNEPVLEAPKSPFLVHDIVGVIYGFFIVSEVLKLRLTSRKFNQTALQTQEDLVDINNTTDALKILQTETDILSSSWKSQLPRLSILAFFIKNADFQSQLHRSMIHTLEFRHLLVVIETLQTPVQRKIYFALIQHKEITEIEFCNQSISNLAPLFSIQVLDALYAILLSKLPLKIQKCNPIIKKERRNLIALIRAYAHLPSAETEQAIKQKANHLFLISKYQKAKFRHHPFYQMSFVIVIVLAAVSLNLFIFFLGSRFLLNLRESKANILIAMGASLHFALANIVLVGVGKKLIMKHCDLFNKTAFFRHLTPAKMNKLQKEADPYLEELNTVISRIGMFKRKDESAEDALRKRLSQKIIASSPL